jgi:hypothetical protein
MNTRKPAEDGGARGRMTRISHYPSMNVHQHDGESLAGRADEFRKLIAAIARKLEPFAVTKEEKQAVWDAYRPTAPRLSMRQLELFCDLAARSDRPFVLEQGIQQAVIQRIAAPRPLCVNTTGVDETAAQGRGDVDRWQFHIERTPTRRDQALDSLGLHKAALGTDMLALMQWNSGKRIFA